MFNVFIILSHPMTKTNHASDTNRGIKPPIAFYKVIQLHFPFLLAFHSCLWLHFRF